MVGVAGENRHGPVNLLHQHDSDELMWPGRRSERKVHIGGVKQASGKAVRSPDNEAGARTPLFAPCANSPGKTVAGGILAPTVEHNLDSVVRNGARQRDRLFCYAAIR